ncbi:hypothetical protein [Microlunatus speluncae]|uniref:hypothetical protein n=1 Tax=Microlunatus speluncae TaxID=2594267 RepID=UPI001375825B|nr:hypothetical protein [Microlunatus speluncae]
MPVRVFDYRTDSGNVIVTPNLRRLAERTNAAVAIAEQRIGELAATRDNPARTKQLVDDVWAGLREVIWQTTATARDWNELAPRSQSTPDGSRR